MIGVNCEIWKMLPLICIATEFGIYSIATAYLQGTHNAYEEYLMFWRNACMHGSITIIMIIGSSIDIVIGEFVVSHRLAIVANDLGRLTERQIRLLHQLCKRK